MREALARSDHDFVLSAEPRRHRAAPRRSLFGAIGLIFWIICRLAAYPNRILGGLVTGLILAILVNALLLQHRPHPAPTLHKTINFSLKPSVRAPFARGPQGLTASHAAGTPLKPAPDPIGRLLRSETTASSAITSHPPPAASGDPIARLLKTETPAAPRSERPVEKARPTADQRVVEAAESATVREVQQALVKLGYVVRADGEMGAITRHAIVQYERDHGLPLDERLSRRLLRRLSAASGITIE